MKINTPHMRLSGIDKNYYLKQLQTFADSFDPNEISAADFGKQDTRGGYSICLFDTRGCVPSQKFFSSKDEMLGYVVGVNEARQGLISNTRL